MKKNQKILAAFIVGQFVQVVANLLAKVSYMSRPILFCIAAGFLILAAVVVGMYLGSQEDTPKHKTYKDYAAPGGLE